MSWDKGLVFCFLFGTRRSHRKQQRENKNEGGRVNAEASLLLPLLGVHKDGWTGESRGRRLCRCIFTVLRGQEAGGYEGNIQLGRWLLIDRRFPKGSERKGGWYTENGAF